MTRGIDGARWITSTAWRSGSWRPAELREIWRRARIGQRGAEARDDHDHLLGAVRWIERAQDVMNDGGICGRYHLATGWTSSYPETTGYLVPTLLRLADELDEPKLLERAGRAIDFLLALQLESGAFPGGEVHENTTRPSVFNTGQILNGLTAWWERTEDPRTLEAARRAAAWLASGQDSDGAWRTNVYLDLPTTYVVHSTCWLAEFARLDGNRDLLECAGRNLDWVLGHRDAETGWFDRAGFATSEHEDRTALTHTIGYVLWGALLTSRALGREDGVSAVRRSAAALATSVLEQGWIAGELDHLWRPRSYYSCLTGNAQFALIWLHLHEDEPDPTFRRAALLALEGVRRAQPLDDPDPDVRGAIPGSDPIWGGYIQGGYPNWAAKFFIDALLEKKRILGGAEAGPNSTAEAPAV
jgi:hypothetical protein